MFDANMRYHIFEDYFSFDEKGSSCGTVRKVQWVKDDKEPDESKAKIEIRKMYINAEGERAAKGYSFSTPEGPNELVKGLIENGFGDTKEILKSIRSRDDFIDAVKNIDKDPDDEYDGEMFDMRDLLSSMGVEEEYEEAV